jgi:hypothetical protein
MDYLLDRRAVGALEVALHGVTHADHRVGTRMAAELVAPRPARVRRLLELLQAWSALFDTRTLIPPHNYIDPAVLATCLDGHAHVCRAVTDDEVASLGLDPSQPEQRAEAKRRMGYRFEGSHADLCQTTGVTPGRLDLPGKRVAETARAILSVADPVGVGVVTFHWWDFVSAGGTMDREYGAAVRTLLGLLESDGVSFSTVSDFAAGCVYGRGGPTN